SKTVRQGVENRTSPSPGRTYGWPRRTLGGLRDDRADRGHLVAVLAHHRTRPKLGRTSQRPVAKQQGAREPEHPGHDGNPEKITDRKRQRIVGARYHLGNQRVELTRQEPFEEGASIADVL